jgi:myo-inositol-1-phosphate synthase
MNESRIHSKRLSKTNSVISASNTMRHNNVHIGPSDHVHWLEDNKIAFIRLEGTHAGGLPWNMEIRLSVEDSPNAAGVLIDAIRLAVVAAKKREFGAARIPCAWCCKSPPEQRRDSSIRDAWIEHFEAQH